MNRSSLVAWFLALGLLACAARAQVYIDFQPPDGVTAAGYVPVSSMQCWGGGTAVALGGGMRGGWTQAFPSPPSPLAGDIEDPLTRDGLLFRPGIAGQTFQVQETKPGNYDLTLVAVSPKMDSQTIFNIDQDGDGSIDKSLTIRNPAGQTSKTVPVAVSANGALSITVSAYGGATGVINGLGLMPGEPDTLPPAPVSDLSAVRMQATAVTLQWSAPADDEGGGARAQAYEIRCATEELTDANWAAAMRSPASSPPSDEGQREISAVRGLTPNTTYHFGIRAIDGCGNASRISNIVKATTARSDAGELPHVGDLSATVLRDREIRLQWTVSPASAPGICIQSDLRCATQPIDNDAAFAAALPVPGGAAPEMRASRATTSVPGLTPGQTYYFALKQSDRAGKWSSLSNTIAVAVPSSKAGTPRRIDDLAVIGTEPNAVTLGWTAVDAGGHGSISSYDVRYSLEPITTDAAFAAAMQVAGASGPHEADTKEQMTVYGLRPNVTYYFAMKAATDDVPLIASSLSNVATAATLAPREPVYGLSNPFTLNGQPAGVRGPEARTVVVSPAAIAQSRRQAGPVYTGTISYDVLSPAPYVHAWLELSTDGGHTWNERWIHAVGAVGTIRPGPGKVARWMVDGDHGPNCRIRVRVTDCPATYSDFDADKNKYPRPAPWSRYPNIERLTDRKDFDFADSRYRLPGIDFRMSVGCGQILAGFARTGFFHERPQDMANPVYFLHCAYLESADGTQKWVILQADVQHVWTDTVHRWRDQIHEAFGIPEDHIMVFSTHLHNHAERIAGIDTFPKHLLEQAVANKQPVEVGFLNKDMGTVYNMHRSLLTGPATAASSWSNDDGAYRLSVKWEYDALWEPVNAVLDGTAYRSPVQRYFDCPLDSYLQMIVFRHVRTHKPVGVLVKFTGHVATGGYPGGLPRAVMDVMQRRIGSDVEIMYTAGFASNHRQLVVPSDPPDADSLRLANVFANALEAELPATEFRPLQLLGTVMGYDTFGAYLQDTARIGLDPDRLGAAVQVFRFNDIYLSALPGEAPSEQGLYIRARTSDLKHMYNAYGNTWYTYYTWGRWFDIQHYEGAVQPNRFETFRMAQEVVRGVNILEQASEERPSSTQPTSQPE